MSKIGRKPIDTGNTNVEVDGQKITYKGKGGSGVHVLPDMLQAALQDKKLIIIPCKTDKNFRKKEINSVWGLHRALLANEIYGVDQGFEKQLKIIGLGYKAAVSGSKVVFSLGYSHKIDFTLPKEVSLTVDKTGQLLTLKSSDKQLLGEVCDKIRSLRPPEPYKGTGVRYLAEVVARKAGKAKSSA